MRDINDSVYTCFFFSLPASEEGVLSPITFWFRTRHILHQNVGSYLRIFLFLEIWQEYNFTLCMQSTWRSAGVRRWQQTGPCCIWTKRSLKSSKKKHFIKIILVCSSLIGVTLVNFSIINLYPFLANIYLTSEMRTANSCKLWISKSMLDLHLLLICRLI